ncbi:phage terminase large subunit [Methylobacterium sp. E-005]|uniref:phage terminase large subunit n=1 Tax=Methylobacterium sp. E-005 TaxID=2836549 RepID=UPI001FBAA40F|nr:phage terminase large subunit [Methylobacterium sp. E-005]MCJ2085521.1 phage terminase large subunit [Methylobacterium sp. E-005]
MQGFNPAPHHTLLIDELEALTHGESDVLLVEMPPGSAKSTYVNWLFPAWFFAQRPEANVLSASHSSELAERWGRRTRNLIASEARTLGIQLSADSTAAYRWGTSQGGEYYAVGVGVGIMGFRADLGIIDDPFGSREDAESKRIRDARWEWYVNDFSSRLKPGAKRVIMHQRWHEDDLAGRVIQQLDAIRKPYRRLKIRAEALLDDPLGRPLGEFLWDDPNGYNYGQFLRDRKAESDQRTWSALYQQEPTPDTGDFFRREWLHPVEQIPARDSLRVYGASDYAVTSGGGDYTVHVVVGIDSDKRLYLLDLWRSQADSAEWVEALADLVLKWKPLEWAEETGQIRAGVGPFLTKRLTERRAYVHRKQFPTRGDKAVRAQSIRGRMSMLGLYVPANVPWRSELEGELLRFPAGVHDDQVDALGLIGQLLDTIHAPSAPKPPTQAVASGYKSTRSSGGSSWRT